MAPGSVTSLYLRPASRKDFHVAILCSLPLRADAVQALFNHQWDDADDKDDYGITFDKAPDDPNSYSTGVIGRHNVVLAHISAILGSYSPITNSNDHALNINGNVRLFENGTAVKRSDTYCVFYSDPVGSQQVSSAHYDVSGHYAKCENGDDKYFRLMQSPNSDINCNSYQASYTRWQPGDLNICYDLNNYINPNFTTYHCANNAQNFLLTLAKWLMMGLVS